MEIIKITTVAIVTAIAVMVIKEYKPDVAIVVGLAGGCLVLITVVDYLIEIFAVFNTIITKSKINSSIASLVLKIIGVGFIVDFSAGICEDSGSMGLSEKIVLGGKIIIMAMALPIITMLFDLIYGIIS